VTIAIPKQKMKVGSSCPQSKCKADQHYFCILTRGAEHKKTRNSAIPFFVSFRVWQMVTRYKHKNTRAPHALTRFVNCTSLVMARFFHERNKTIQVMSWLFSRSIRERERKEKIEWNYHDHVSSKFSKWLSRIRFPLSARVTQTKGFA